MTCGAELVGRGLELGQVVIDGADHIIGLRIEAAARDATVREHEHTAGFHPWTRLALLASADVPFHLSRPVDGIYGRIGGDAPEQLMAGFSLSLLQRFDSRTCLLRTVERDPDARPRRRNRARKLERHEKSVRREHERPLAHRLTGDEDVAHEL